MRRGVEQEFARAERGVLPAARFVLRRILVHPVDSAESRNEDCGRKAAAEALHRLERQP